MTSGSSFGNGISPPAADNISRVLVADELNRDLQWSEGSYRGFFTLTVDTEKVNATYWAMRNTSAYLQFSIYVVHKYAIVGFANLDAFPSAQFIVQKGESCSLVKSFSRSKPTRLGANKLQRPVAGGKVLAGVLQASVVANKTS